MLALLAGAALDLAGSRSRQLVGELVTEVATGDSLVALTFDDGPVPLYTDSILDLLDEFGAKATFFAVGASVERNPELAAAVVARGHELANHSLTHRRMMARAPGAIRREIERTDSLLRAAGQADPIWVRPPYGKRLLQLPLHLARSGRPVVLWSLEPDTYHRDAEGMARYVSEGVRPGSIVLLHVEIPGRVEERRALRDILEELRERGYRMVTLGELMRRRSRRSAPSPDEEAIRAARAAFNDAIARHDLDAIRPFLADDYRAAVSNGTFRTSPQAMVDAFAERFAAFPDATYERVTRSVQVSGSAPAAWEEGDWVGRWTTGDGPFRTGGRYAADWRLTGERWRLHAELFVPLWCEGSGC